MSSISSFSAFPKLTFILLSSILLMHPSRWASSYSSCSSCLEICAKQGELEIRASLGKSWKRSPVLQTSKAVLSALRSKMHNLNPIHHDDERHAGNFGVDEEVQRL